MEGRFGNIKFNLMRAIELFQDMNHHDMDVVAPPSGDDFFKEHEVATRLNNCLTQMIEEGVFDDCDEREPDGSEDDGFYAPDSQESGGFDFEPESEQASGGSLTGTVKRYVRGMFSNFGRSRHHANEEPEAEQEDESNYEDEEEFVDDGSSLGQGSRQTGFDDSQRSVSGSGRSTNTRQSSASSGSRRLERRSRSRSRRDHDDQDRERSVSSRHSGSHGEHSRERSGSEPYDPNVVYEHRHHHKHNHPGPHHHHGHSDHHTHSYHSHANETRPLSEVSDDENSVGGISNAFPATRHHQDEELSSEAVGSSRPSSRSGSVPASSSRRSRSRSNRSGRSRSRSNRSGRSSRSSQSRGRSSSRASRR